MKKKTRKDSVQETTVVIASSELSAREIKRQAKRDAKATEFHQSWLTKVFRNGIWPSLFPFVLVMIFLVILPLLAIILESILKVNVDASDPRAVTGDHFAEVFKSGGIWKAIGLSVGYALVASIMCVILGYPIAYIMAQMRSRILAKNVWVLVTMPIWISMLLKVLGLKTLFSLMSTTFIGTPICIIVGMIYMFIPFAVGPMYDSILIRDTAQEEAAKDLGCSGTRTFFTITLRNTAAGMLTGFSLVIVQAATSLIVVHYLGGGDTTLVASIIESYFIAGGPSTWGIGSAIAVVLTVIVFIIMLVIALATKQLEKNRKSKKNKWKSSEEVVISHS